MKKSPALKVVGSSLPRVDGEEKVTGRAVYTSDLQVPGIAFGKILRSPYAHARLLKVDAQKAARLPGVITVLSRDDIARYELFGAAYKDQPIIPIHQLP